MVPIFEQHICGASAAVTYHYICSREHNLPNGIRDNLVGADKANVHMHYLVSL